MKKGIDISKKIVYNRTRRKEMLEGFLGRLCESGGTGRRARLRGVWYHHTGSSPVSRTMTTRICVSFFLLHRKLRKELQSEKRCDIMRKQKESVTKRGGDNTSKKTIFLQSPLKHRKERKYAEKEVEALYAEE